MTTETMAAGAAPSLAVTRPGPSIDRIEAPRKISATLLGSWRLLCALALLGGAAGLLASHLVPAWFASTVQLALVPIDDPTTAVTTDAASAEGAELPLLVATLRSRRVGEEAVARFDLEHVYGAPSPDDARLELERHLRITADENAHLVTLRVEDRQPWRARDLARFLGEAGSEASASLWQARTREHRRRLEARLSEVAAELASKEEAMRRFRERSHVVQLDEQVKATVAEAAALAHLKTQKRLGLHFAGGFGGADSPEVRRAEREAAGARAVLSELLHDEGGHLPFLSLDALPALEQEHEQLRRAVAVSGAAWELLARQVEQLRALEARPVGRAEVLDPPSLARHRERPLGSVMAAEGGASGLLAGALLSLLLSWRRSRRAPASEAPVREDHALRF